VQVTWDGSPSGMPTAQVNQIGTFKTSFVVPSGAAGSHTVTVAEVSSAGKTKAVSAAIAAVTFTLMALIATTAPTTAPAHPVVLGAYIPGAPSDPSKIDAYASLTGTMPHIVMWYQEWAGQWNTFYAKGADAIRARGAMPLISWEPWAGTTTDPLWSLNTIIDGSHDSYIHQWTHDVAAWGHPIYVRPMYEMNGPSSAWGYGVNGNTAADFVTAWRHMVDIARVEGATNIRWVWCPNEDDGDPRYTSYASLYPGDAYVDWVGIDGYNWGTTQTWSSWQSPYDVFKGSVDKIVAVTGKPLMIGEIASTELGGAKAAWITNGFARLLTDLPQVRAVTWFDSNKETDWRVDSSTQSLNAFRAVATSGAFAATLP
jgi:Glycosyl hydrolase family 26